MKATLQKKVIKIMKLLCLCCVIAGVMHLCAVPAHAPSVDTGVDTGDSQGAGLSVDFNGEGATLAGSMKILIALTAISLAPSILIMLTSFTRIIIVLHFTRNALGTQTSPPNQVIIGLA